MRRALAHGAALIAGPPISRRHSTGDAKDDVVTPWSVAAAGPKGVDYGRVLTRFMSEPLGDDILNRLESLYAERAVDGSKPRVHHLLRRRIAFSHRDFGRALDEVRASFASGAPRAYLYTGRGPSARSMHIGHVIPFLLTRHLQEALGLPVVIQITDDEKFFFRDIPVENEEIVSENIKDIIAFGFDPRRTFIFRNTAYMGDMYQTVVRVQRLLTLSAVKNTLGLSDSDNIGKAAFPSIQAAPCFSSAFPRVLPLPDGAPPLQCIVPCAIDQDPFFVLTRTAAPRMKSRPPALLHTKFLPALKGLQFKMSSSEEANGVVTLHDTEAQVRKKLRRAFSGGCGTLEDMRTKGVDLDADVAYQFIRFFCPDDELLADVTAKYSCGEINSAHVKDMAADVVEKCVLTEWRARREAVTDADVKHFCSVRNILV